LLLSDLLQERLNFAGTLVVLVSVAACGTALGVQSTLGDLLAAWRDRLRQLWQNGVLTRARRKERREKERNRRRVITKHLQRVAEEKQKNAPPPPESHRPSMAAAGVSVGAPPPEHIDLPLRPRVTERKGEADFGFRRVPAPEPDEDFPAMPAISAAVPAKSGSPSGSPYAAPAPRSRPATVPQKELPFVGEVAPGT